MAGAGWRGIPPAPVPANHQGFPPRAHVNSNRKKSARELRQGGAGYRCCIPALAGLARPQSIASGTPTLARNAAHGNPVSRTTVLPWRISGRANGLPIAPGRRDPPWACVEMAKPVDRDVPARWAHPRRSAATLSAFALFGDAPGIAQVATGAPGFMRVENRRDER